MLKFLKSFRNDQSGAVTVDWVVLCAAIVGFVALIVATMESSSTGLANDTAGFLTNWTF